MIRPLPRLIEERPNGEPSSQVVQPPPNPWTRAERVGWPLAGFGLWAICSAFVLRENPAFFFFDDVEHELMPMIRAIGPDLGLFHWPSLSLRTWAVSYLDAEQVLGHFNPVNRVLYRWMATQDDFRLAAATYALIHLGLLYVATYFAARAFRASPGASSVAAFAMATSNVIVYWYAVSWWNILASLPWFVFAVCARVGKAPYGVRLIGVTVASYLVFTAFAIHTAIALVVFMTLLDLSDWRRRRNVVAVTAGTCGVAIAILLSAHAWLPLLHHLPVSARGAVRESADALSAQFGDLLQVGFPMFRPNMMLFRVYGRAAVPMFYIGWFVTTLLLLAPAARWRQIGKTHWPLMACALVFFCASQGPEMIGPVRFAFRFMPFWIFALLLVTARVATNLYAVERSPMRSGIAMLVALYAIVYALQKESGTIEWLTLLLWVAATGALVFRRVESDTRMWMFCLLVSICFFVQTHVSWWSNGNLTGWGSPESASAYRQAEPQGQGRYTMYFVPTAWEHEGSFYDELATGNIALNSGRNVVFGYTPTGHGAFNRTFCMFFLGWVCDRAIDRALERDPTTGARLIDLMRVDEVITTLAAGPRFASHVTDGEWQEASQGRSRSRRWMRTSTRLLPGSISWVAPALTVAATDLISAEHERYAIGRRSTPSEIVFARLFLDGYRLTIDGAPITPHALDGFVLAATLPAGDAATLQLDFVDPSLQRGRLLAALGTACLGVLLWFGRHNRIAARATGWPVSA